MRIKMSQAERAKQFMPFAALKGFSEALQKKEKAFVPQAELSEEYQEELNRRLQKIRKDDFISIVYYHNGEYLRISGAVSKIDKTIRMIKVVNTEIRFDDIYDIDNEIMDMGES